MTEPRKHGPDESTHHFGIPNPKRQLSSQEPSPHHATIRRLKEQFPPLCPSARSSGQVRASLLRSQVGLTDHSARSLPPDIAAPPHHPLNSAGWCEGGPNVEEEDGLAGRLGRAAVVVDNVAHLLLLAIDVSSDVPVVTVERGLSAAILLVRHSLLAERKRRR